MKPFHALSAFVMLISACLSYSKSFVLQNGLHGYEGAKDVHVTDATYKTRYWTIPLCSLYTS